MKICITALGSNLNSPIDPRFGRAQYFLFLDEKGELKESVLNPGVGAMRGAGVASAQEIVNRGAEILITGNIGPNAFLVLSQTGIKVFLAPPGISAKEAFLLWKENRLNLVQAPTVPGHFGLGRGRGRKGGPPGRGFGGPRRFGG